MPFCIVVPCGLSLLEFGLLWAGSVLLRPPHEAHERPIVDAQ